MNTNICDLGWKKKSSYYHASFACVKMGYTDCLKKIMVIKPARIETKIKLTVLKTFKQITKFWLGLDLYGLKLKQVLNSYTGSVILAS